MWKKTDIRDPILTGSTKKLKLLEKKYRFGHIFDNFQCKKCVRKVSPFQSRLLKDLELFWSSFWYLFRIFSVGFLTLTQSAFLITLLYDINDFGVKNGMRKSLLSKWFSMWLSEAIFEAQFVKGESKVNQNLINISSKMWSVNRCIFGRRSLHSWVQLRGRTGGRGG